MAGKSINEYGAFTGNPDAVNILVQEKSQGTDHSQAEHKKADLDALLNKKIVQTITENDTTHVPSADAVYDALLTESTARANADTALGQDITAEATARQSADTALGQRINANSKEIANLKQKAGDEIVVNYPDSTYGRNEVPASVAQYAKVKALSGVSRVENNAVKNGDFSDGTTNWQTSVATLTASDGVATFTANAQNGQMENTNAITLDNTHFYLYSLKVKGASSNNGLNAIISGAGAGSVALNSMSVTTSWQTFMGVFKPQNNSTTAKVTIYDGGSSGWDAYQIKDVFFTDLSVYFGTTDLSFLGATNAEKLATIQQKYSELLMPSDYGTGTKVDTTYSAVKSVGVNIWDEASEVGKIDITNGQTSSGSGQIRSKNYIPVIGNTGYYYHTPFSNGIVIAYYDIDKNYLGYEVGVVNTNKTTPTNCAYLKFYTYQTYGETYNHDIQICLNSYADKTTYHPYMTDNLTLPEPVTLRSAGSVADTDELNVEVLVDGQKVEKRRQTTRVYAYTITGNENFDYGHWDTDTISMQYATTDHLAKSYGACLCPFYLNMQLIGNQNGTYVRWKNGTTNWASLDAFKADAVGKTIVWELAEESVTLLDPILEPFIQVEGGGTIEPVQSQSIKIDHAFTAEYLAI